MDKHTAQKLIETYCVDQPTAGALERLIALAENDPRVIVREENGALNDEIVIARNNDTALTIRQADLDALLYTVSAN